MDAMNLRRSIRRYTEEPVTKEEIESILEAGMKAPSAKNRQPWRFVVVTGREKESMVSVMKRGLESEQEGNGLLKESGRHLAGADYTRQIMEQAPVTIFVLNAYGGSPLYPLAGEDRFYEMANLQSIGAAIQNMSLRAVELSLGSLWICDVFFAYRELTEWLQTKDQLVAALCIGHPGEEPAQMPRRAMDKVVKWK